MNFTNIDDVRRALSERGVNLHSKSIESGLEHAREKARVHARRQASDAANPGAADVLKRFINWSVIAIVAIVSAMIVLAIAGLFVVETIAVYDGFYIILGRTKALISSVVLMSAFYVLMFIAESVRESHTDTAVRFSLRSMWRRVGYFIGLPRGGWTAEMKENVAYSNALEMQRFMLWVIVFLSILGRLSPILLQTADMPATEGAQFLLYETSLVDWLSTLGIALATGGTLASSHFMFAFIYKSFVRVTGGLDLGKSPASYDALYEELADSYQLRYLTDLYHRKTRPTETSN